MSFDFNITVLHSHGGHSGLAHLLSEKLGRFGEFIDEVILHGLIELLKIIPFLFLTYLLMEFIEHKAGDKTAALMKRGGGLGPLIGGAVGLLPQCGFSSVAANLYSCKVISLGTLIAVFLATSDEMLPILIGNPKIGAVSIILILAYKLFAAIAVGFIIDLILRLAKKEREDINIDELCDNDNCHCERGILHSAIHHTLTISLFILICTLLIGTAVFFIGEERIAAVMYDKPLASHLICAVFGLIPNCAASVVLTEFYTSGFISGGSMLSGLFSGSGVGLLVLLRVNRHPKINFIIIGILIGVGTVFGLLADLIGFLAL
ncbi:MAG: arsenic efflux protein [Clostridia bacterium]|nr:arsenic efflux protein [Clostridia bacterium]